MLKLSYINKKWEVLESFTVHVKGASIEVPVGFMTDIASTPRFMWAIFPPFGNYNIACIVHDYLYCEAQLKRKDCDEIFYLLMREESSIIVSLLFYKAVRLLGWLSYGKKNNI